MKRLPRLIYLLELTRSMPQYGYALSGGYGKLSNLAEHQYLVAIIAWQLALAIKKEGGKIDVEKVVGFALIHDLGELFGGDISMPYAVVNPEARTKAKAFEAENHKFLSRFFDDGGRFDELSGEILEAQCDEAVVAKVADYVEITMFKQFIDKYSNKDMNLALPKLREKIGKMEDEIAQKTLNEFLNVWEKEASDFETFDLKIKQILNEKND